MPAGAKMAVAFRTANATGTLDKENGMSFELYSIGFAILISRLIYAVHLGRMPAMPITRPLLLSEECAGNLLRWSMKNSA
jgi:hypothetical protein